MINWASWTDADLRVHGLADEIPLYDKHSRAELILALQKVRDFPVFSFFRNKYELEFRNIQIWISCPPRTTWSLRTTRQCVLKGLTVKIWTKWKSRAVHVIPFL